MTYILGISAFYHDSAAALIHDGRILAAVQEERFSRHKHDARFPRQAVRHCLEQAGITLDGVEAVAFYDKPLLKFERLLETHLACAPRSFPAFARAMPVWLKEKLFLKRLLRQELAAIDGRRPQAVPPLRFPSHHQSHAASAFYPSPFTEAAVLCLDGVGEWATTSAWRGQGQRLDALWQQDFPHSLGLLYSAFTAYCGFRVNEGEYKLMGLAPYGEPVYRDLILDELVRVEEDGGFRLNLDYFAFACGQSMTSARFHRRFGGPPRRPDGPLEQRHMDLAASIQALTEEIVLRLARSLREESGLPRLCLAGGVALNCVANGKLRESGLFEDIWIQPAAGDAGGALGAALAVWHQHLDAPRTPSEADAMAGAYLGPAYDDADTEAALRRAGARYRRLDEAALLETVARRLDEGAVVGWFQGRAEFGPRALGNRSILADPRPPHMQSRVNQKIKFRESFRPFAPAVLAEHQGDWFEMTAPSPYMLFVTRLRPERLNPIPEGVTGLERLRIPRSAVPAVTHVDGSARVQTVSAGSNPRFHRLIQAFHRRSGCPMVVNTSFNVRDEPIVLTPEDALRCFAHTDMDCLALGPFLVEKAEQAADLKSRLPAPPPPRPAAPYPEATPGRLREFAGVTALLVFLLFGLLLPWLGDGPPRWGLLPWVGAWAAWGLVLPRSLAPVYRAWMALGLRLGRITTPLILALVYFLLLTPMGWLMRRLGHDPLRRPGPARRPSPPPHDMEKPF